jgi:hypothetical protein
MDSHQFHPKGYSLEKGDRREWRGRGYKKLSRRHVRSSARNELALIHQASYMAGEAGSNFTA